MAETKAAIGVKHIPKSIRDLRPMPPVSYAPESQDKPVSAIEKTRQALHPEAPPERPLPLPAIYHDEVIQNFNLTVKALLQLRDNNPTAFREDPMNNLILRVYEKHPRMFQTITSEAASEDDSQPLPLEEWSLTTSKGKEHRKPKEIEALLPEEMAIIEAALHRTAIEIALANKRFIADQHAPIRKESILRALMRGHYTGRKEPTIESLTYDGTLVEFEGETSYNTPLAEYLFVDNQYDTQDQIRRMASAHNSAIALREHLFSFHPGDSPFARDDVNRETMRHMQAIQNEQNIQNIQTPEQYWQIYKEAQKRAITRLAATEAKAILESDNSRFSRPDFVARAEQQADQIRAKKTKTTIYKKEVNAEEESAHAKWEIDEGATEAQIRQAEEKRKEAEKESAHAKWEIDEGATEAQIRQAEEKRKEAEEELAEAKLAYEEKRQQLLEENEQIKTFNDAIEDARRTIRAKVPFDPNDPESIQAYRKDLRTKTTKKQIGSGENEKILEEPMYNEDEIQGFIDKALATYNAQQSIIGKETKKIQRILNTKLSSELSAITNAENKLQRLPEYRQQEEEIGEEQKRKLEDRARAIELIIARGDEARSGEKRFMHIREVMFDPTSRERALLSFDTLRDVIFMSEGDAELSKAAREELCVDYILAQGLGHSLGFTGEDWAALGLDADMTLLSDNSLVDWEAVNKAPNKDQLMRNIEKGIMERLRTIGALASAEAASDVLLERIQAASKTTAEQEYPAYYKYTYIEPALRKYYDEVMDAKLASGEEPHSLGEPHSSQDQDDDQHEREETPSPVAEETPIALPTDLEPETIQEEEPREQSEANGAQAVPEAISSNHEEVRLKLDGQLSEPGKNEHWYRKNSKAIIRAVMREIKERNNYITVPNIDNIESLYVYVITDDRQIPDNAKPYSLWFSKNPTSNDPDRHIAFTDFASLQSFLEYAKDGHYQEGPPQNSVQVMVREELAKRLDPKTIKENPEILNKIAQELARYYFPTSADYIKKLDFRL